MEWNTAADSHQDYAEHVRWKTKNITKETLVKKNSQKQQQQKKKKLEEAENKWNNVMGTITVQSRSTKSDPQISLASYSKTLISVYTACLC